MGKGVRENVYISLDSNALAQGSVRAFGVADMKSCYIVLHNATLVLLAAHIGKCYNGIVKK